MKIDKVKKKNILKITSFVMIFVLLISCFGGCNKSDNEVAKEVAQIEQLVLADAESLLPELPEESEDEKTDFEKELSKETNYRTRVTSTYKGDPNYTFKHENEYGEVAGKGNIEELEEIKENNENTEKAEQAQEEAGEKPLEVVNPNPEEKEEDAKGEDNASTDTNVDTNDGTSSKDDNSIVIIVGTDGTMEEADEKSDEEETCEEIDKGLINFGDEDFVGKNEDPEVVPPIEDSEEENMEDVTIDDEASDNVNVPEETLVPEFEEESKVEDSEAISTEENIETVTETVQEPQPELQPEPSSEVTETVVEPIEEPVEEIIDDVIS